MRRIESAVLPAELAGQRDVRRGDSVSQFGGGVRVDEFAVVDRQFGHDGGGFGDFRAVQGVWGGGCRGERRGRGCCVRERETERRKDDVRI